MGCQQGKQSNANSTVRKCLREIDQMIKSIETLNASYLEDNKIAFKMDPSINKVEEFVKQAYQHHQSQSSITSTTTTQLQAGLSFDEYTKQLVQYQQNSRSIILNGFSLYEQGQQIEKSLMIQTLLQKLVYLQNFSLKLKIPSIHCESYQGDLEKKLQVLVKQISQSQEMDY